MNTYFDWKVNDQVLPEHECILFALPGVGNVGKLLIDTLNESFDSEEIVRLYHPDLPPHAKMVNGLLTPPHLYLKSLKISREKTILTLCGDVQPLVPRGQYEMAEEILKLLSQNNCKKLILLAGLSSDAGCDKIHIVVADESTKDFLNNQGISVSRTQPEGGVIGLCGLLGSLAPSRNIQSVVVIAETFGTSVDTVAAERLRTSLEQYFGINLPVNVDRTEKLARDLIENYSEGPGALVSKELLMPDDSFYQ